MDKRLTHELGFATNIAIDPTINTKLNKLHQLSNGTITDAREGLFAKVRNAVMTNIYDVIGAPSTSFPTNEHLKLKCTL